MPTIWETTKAKNEEASQFLLKHWEECASCNVGKFNECENGRKLLDNLAHSPLFPTGFAVQKAGECPVGGTSPAACFMCTFGHMTECHAPLDCKTAQCSHLRSYEDEDI